MPPNLRRAARRLFDPSAWSAAALLAALLASAAPAPAGAQAAPAEPASAVARHKQSVLGAQPPANPAPGRYVTLGGWGELQVSAGPAGRVDFQLDAVGANAHSCSLQGSARQGLAELPTDEGQPACRVRFSPAPRGGVDVTSESDAACHGFCGARAWFPGRYEAEPAECAAAARARVDAEFQRQYKAGRYDAAYARLAPVLSACGELLRPDVDGRLRNDLAVTLFHLHRPADCRAALAPLLETYPGSEDDLRENLPPADFEQMAPILRAARHNAKLCAAP
jgi:hypothetical protein